MKSMALWYQLLGDVQVKIGVVIFPRVEQYLAGMLNEYVSRNVIADTIFAEEWMRAMGCEGSLRRRKLREVGDKALIYAGFFPKRARRLNVDEKYFQEMGVSAYRYTHESFSREGDGRGDVFFYLHKQFPFLVRVLWVMREAENASSAISQIGIEGRVFH